MGRRAGWLPAEASRLIGPTESLTYIDMIANLGQPALPGLVCALTRLLTFIAVLHELPLLLSNGSRHEHKHC